MRNRFFLAKRILQDHFRESIQPYKLTFASTDRCNSRCRTCATWRYQARDELNCAEIENFFSINNRFLWLDFTGGEYFLREDALEIVRIALFHCRHCCHFHVPTNAVDPQRTLNGVRKIIDCKPELFTLTISLDGPPSVHDRLRGIPGNWNAAMALYRELEGLQSNKFRIFFGFTLSPWNLGSFSATVTAVQQQFPKVGLKNFHMNLYHRSEHYYRTEGHAPPFPGGNAAIITEMEQFRKDVRWRLDPISILENRYLLRIREYLETKQSPLPCQALAGSLFLAADGTVYPCTMWNQPLGNLRRDGFSLPELLKSSHEIRAAVRGKKCPGCWTPCEAYPSILACFFNKG
ncbi:MAG: radical SAM protein [Magnetococcales bacterium]|nr:radical SAM protein [Magnetococcales bacterium]